MNPTDAFGPVRARSHAHSALRPGNGGEITGGLWHERRRINRQVSVPAGWDRLHDAGNFHNLELAAGLATGDYVNELPFLDSDVYKWLEAIGWVLADPELTAESASLLGDWVRTTRELLAAVQQPDGYLDSHFQVRFPGERFVQLPWGHELYCAGHLIQAAIALHRTSADEELLALTRRIADLVVASFGPGPDQIDGVCGHPEIETALVELYRETGEQAYLDTASFFVDRRGHGLLGDGRFGRHYWQDHLPIREAPGVAGHAVRQLYLLAGAADVYAETGDPALLAALERLWTEMVATKTYLTGGIGAHHTDEAFGDPYELPSERSYCETCAAIASIQFCWRMLIITGEAKYADLLERTLYNGFLAGTSLDGQSYIYANPLQVRDDHLGAGTDQDYKRVPWFACACCPPNVMRLLGSLQHYVLLGGDRRIALHAYVAGRFSAPVADGQAILEVTTDYPWDGTVIIQLMAGPDAEWELALRIPAWADDATLTVNGASADGSPSEGWWVVARRWSIGDVIRLELPMTARFTAGDPRLDAVRGAAAIERGPLVYCLESVDQGSRRLDDLVLDPASEPVAETDADVLDGVLTLRAAGRTRTRSAEPWWPYRPVRGAQPDRGEPITLTAVPYFSWGNRGPGAMRIWIPLT